MFKTELHTHSFPVSTCSIVSPEELVDDYISHGYNTVVITNHLSRYTADTDLYKNKTQKEKADVYLDDYRRAKKHADGRINVLLGMEYNNVGGYNDFLVYGIDEEFVYNAKDIVHMPLTEALDLFHKNCAIIFQAHPFRKFMTPVDPTLVDGAEAGNYCNTRQNFNELAEQWIKNTGLKRMYGTDYHATYHMVGAGILTDEEIKTNEQLVDILKNQQFKVTDGKRVFELN